MAVASMSTPGGMLAPVEVYAAAETVTTTAEMFEIRDAKGVVDTTKPYLAAADALTEGLTFMAALKEEHQDYQGTVTTFYQKKDAGSWTEFDGSNKIEEAGTYKIAVKVAAGTGEGDSDKNLGEVTEELEVGEFTIVTELPDDAVIKYQQGDDGEPSETPKTVYKNAAVKVSAQDYTLCETPDGSFAPAVEIAAPGQDGELTKLLYFRNGENALFAKELTLNFDVTAPTIKSAAASDESAEGATVTVTVNGTEDGAKYTLANKDASGLYAGDDALTNDTGVFEITGLAAGTQYTFTAVVTDAAGNASAGTEVTFTTAKAAFSGTDVTLAADPYDADAHTVKFTGIDGKAAADYEFTVDGENWTTGGTPIATSGETLSVDGTTVTVTLNENNAYAADKIGVRIKATDKAEASPGATYGEAIRAVLVLKSQVMLTGTPKFGEALTASASSDQTSSLTYTFYRVKDDTETEITSNTTGTYTLAKDDIGCKIRVKVTAAGYDDPTENGTSDDTAVVEKADGQTIASLSGALSDNADHTKFVVTLAEVDGAKYAVGDGTGDDVAWQDSNVFEVDPSQIGTVTFAAYIPGDDTTADGTPQTADVTIAKLSQATPALNYDVVAGEGSQRTVTIQEVAGAQYSFEGDVADKYGTANSKAFDNSTTTSVTIAIRLPETATQNASTAVTDTIDLTQSIAEAPAACTAEATAKGSFAGYTVTITSTHADYEYSFDNQTWSKTATHDYDPSEDDQTVTVYVRNAPSGSIHSAAVSTTVDLAALLVKAPAISGQTSFKGSTSVTITCGTPGAKIYYTTDGSTPTTASTEYTGAFTLSDTATVKAIAAKDNMKTTDPASETFTKTGEADSGNTGGGNTGGSSSGGSSGGSSTQTPSTETKPDGTKVETSTETKPDGTKVDTVVETKPDGTKTETVTETKTDGSKTETVTQAKPDGSKTETVTETKTDGSKTETVTVAKPDGTKNETVKETAADGTVKKTTETVTQPDGSATKTQTAGAVNSKGKDTTVTTTTKTDAKGAVTSVTEKTVIPESTATTSTTVTVKKDGSGEITSAKAAVENTVSDGSKATVSAAVVSQITEAAGTENVAVTMTVKDKAGNTKYKVKVNTGDLESGNDLYIYRLNTKTGEYTMVDAKIYTVNEAGSVSVSMSKKATYELVDSAKASEINKKIKATIKPKKSKTTVAKGKKTTFALSGKANKDNIKSITYTTSNKKIATVNKNGKITAKKSGTVTVKAKVTLKNGTTKTIKMKVKVKK